MSRTLERPAGAVRSAAHAAGVVSGLAAGVWLGAAEAPVKLVNEGLSPYAISASMVAGVFVARWSLPTLFQGTRQVFRDLSAHRHLIPVAILAGMLWAVANTLTVYAIRDVGLAVAFPLWNMNSLVGILWGWLLFGELRGAGRGRAARVILGAVAILAAAVLLGAGTLPAGGPHAGRAVHGVLAAGGASLLWGTMYIPYRKAYISGMNPLSFVTVFTVGELGSCLLLWLALDRGSTGLLLSSAIRGVLFWLFVGGFVWVIGDIFQQYATKYLGIGRGIPLSNTNQLWGLAWAGLVFGELAHAGPGHRLAVVLGSAVMILGAMAVATAVASEGERAAAGEVLRREQLRYRLHSGPLPGSPPSASDGWSAGRRRAWWDYLILAASIGVFVWLGRSARIPSLSIDRGWTAALTAVLALTAAVAVLSLGRARELD